MLDVAAPLTIGTVELDDGSRHPGFLCEGVAATSAPDITHLRRLARVPGGATMTVETTRFLLEPAAYTDDGWFAREQRLVFGRTWHVVAHVEQLALPGDFVTVTSAAPRS